MEEKRTDKKSEDMSRRDEILDLGSSTARSEKGVIHCLTIVGQVEGHMLLPDNTKSTKYEHHAASGRRGGIDESRAAHPQQTGAAT
jgi:hypothetical protein